MTLLACEMNATVWYFKHSLVLPFFGTEMKTDLFQSCMATHSSTLAWKRPWTEEPGRLQSMGSLRFTHD